MDCGVGERLLRLTKVLEQSKTSPETRTLRREQSFNFQVFQQTVRSYTTSLKARLVGDSQIGAGLIQGGERRRFAMSVPIPLRRDFNAAPATGVGQKAR